MAAVSGLRVPSLKKVIFEPTILRDVNHNMLVGGKDLSLAGVMPFGTLDEAVELATIHGMVWQ